MTSFLLGVLLAAAAPAALTPTLPSNCSAAQGFAGTVCVPSTPGRHPAIILLGGSEGGDRMALAAPQFARAGYVAASVAYFGAPGLPSTLENVPVETVGRALTIVSARTDVDPQRIGIFGGSKGGELALLAASLYPAIHAVVADVPSPFAWQGISNGPSAQTNSSWTWQGKAVPFVPYGNAMGTQFAQAFMNHQPLDLRPGYEASMQQNASAVPAAMFHLENIAGPVFFIAADDDQIWNSVAQSQMGMAYLKAHGHAYADRYVHFPGAGHLFLFAAPQRPLTQSEMGPVTLLLGGTPQANMQAADAAWPQIMAFLGAALK